MIRKYHNHKLQTNQWHRAVQYQLLVNFINVGPPGVLGIWGEWLGRMAIYFQGPGVHWLLFSGILEHAHSFGDLERALQEKKIIKSYLKGKAFTSFDFF